MQANYQPEPFTAAALEQLLDHSLPALPELELARANPAALREQPQTRQVLAQTQAMLQTLAHVPQTSYTHYRLFLRSGERSNYEYGFFRKRMLLAGAALRLFLGIDTDAAPSAERPIDTDAFNPPQPAPASLRDTVQDYIWSICEESSWVLPAHELGGSIDLFAAETAFVLAEAVLLLGPALDAEIRHRVYREVDRRVLDPYLHHYQMQAWYKASHNWNGVCNGAIAAALLLLEPDTARVAQGLEIALRGLQHFIGSAFEHDGSSTEGVSYWHYGLINLVALAEMLRSRSRGAIDLLAGERMRSIAAYPPHMQLSGPWFANFSDCEDTLSFNPGIIARLAERTATPALLNLLAAPAQIGGDWRLTMMLRNMLWWDGRQPTAALIADAYLPAASVARLVAQTPDGAQVVLAIKAGHNQENHNQNDIGSLIVHVDGENLLCDPGRGLYSRDYFGERRYENIFANSYGHSVPRIDGQLQGSGAQFAGQILAADLQGSPKSVQIELARAYPVADLLGLRRSVELGADGQIVLQDHIRFAQRAGEVEEALLSWYPISVDGALAHIHGQRATLQIRLEAPPGAQFAVERLEQACRENAKDGVLSRLSLHLPPGAEQTVRLHMTIVRGAR